MQGGTRGGQRHGTREALVSSPPQTPRAPPLLEPPWEEVLRRASLQWGDGMGHADELLHGRRHTELDRVREVRHGSLPSHPSRAASPRTQPTLLGVYAACHAVRPSLPPSLLPRLLQVLRSHLPLLREAFGRFADTPGLAATVEAGGKLPLEMGATGERAEAGGPSAPKGHRQMSLGQFWRLLHESRLEPDGMPPALPAAEFSEDFEPLDEGRLEAHMRARAKAHTHVPPLPPPGPLRELVTAHHPLRAGGLAHVVRALLRAAGGGSSLELASTPLPHERFGRLLTHHVQPMMQRLAPPPPYDERAHEQLRVPVVLMEAEAGAALKTVADKADKVQREVEPALKAELEAEVTNIRAALELARAELKAELKVAAAAKAAAVAAEQRASDAEARATRASRPTPDARRPTPDAPRPTPRATSHNPRPRSLRAHAHASSARPPTQVVAVVQQHVVGLAEVFGHWRGAGGEGGGRERGDGAGGEEGGASEADGVATVHAMRRAQAAGSGGELLRHLAAAGCGPQQPPVAMQPLQPAQDQTGSGGASGDAPRPAARGSAASEARSPSPEGGGCRGCCNLNDLLHLLQATHITGADFSAEDASDLFREVTHLRCEPRVCAANRDSPIVFDTWVRRAALLGLQPHPSLPAPRSLRAAPRPSRAAPAAGAPQASRRTRCAGRCAS